MDLFWLIVLFFYIKVVYGIQWSPDYIYYVLMQTVVFVIVNEVLSGCGLVLVDLLLFRVIMWKNQFNMF
jgi:hypothetical protein